MNDDLWLSLSASGRSHDDDAPDWRRVWFERDAVPRMIVTRELAVLAINASARALVVDHAVITVRDGVLGAKDRRSAAKLAETVLGAGADAHAILVDNPAGGPGVMVEAVALDDHDATAVGLALRDLGVRANIECADLEALFGVTPGEHQVVVQLLKGYSSREIAAQAGKSILTIRTHVKRAYGKIGVKTRGQLFARLAGYLSIR